MSNKLKIVKEEFANILSATLAKERLRTPTRLGALIDVLQEALAGLQVAMQEIRSDAEGKLARMEARLTEEEELVHASDAHGLTNGASTPPRDQ